MIPSGTSASCSFALAYKEMIGEVIERLVGLVSLR